LSRGLAAAWTMFANGDRRATELRRAARAEVEKGATSVDYVDLADADSIAILADGSTVGDRALLAIACRVGTTRLIDNVVLGEDPSPPGVA
jgi:pantoate--beta-alanine ligase